MPQLTIMDKRETRIEAFEVEELRNNGTSIDVLVAAGDGARFRDVRSDFIRSNLIYMYGGDCTCRLVEPRQDGSGATLVCLDRVR